MFKTVELTKKWTDIEKGILELWEDKNIFQQSLDQNVENEHFVFFEGPPTANGKPGIHHILARAYKDLVCRYKTMQGYYVPRKAGWDTHGLPVELEVEKRLKINGKHEIEEYGIEKFIEKCKEVYLPIRDSGKTMQQSVLGIGLTWNILILLVRIHILNQFGGD